MRSDLFDTLIAAGGHTDAMIALVPSETDARRLAVDDGEPADELHVTLAYLGDAAMIPVEVRRALVDRVSKCVQDKPTVVGNAFSVNLFNPDDKTITAGGGEPCVVLGVGGGQLTKLRGEVISDVRNVMIATGVDFPEQHTPWVPHMTLVYTGEADLTYFTDRMGPVTFDTVRLAFGDDVYDIPLGDNVNDTDVTAAGDHWKKQKRAPGGNVDGGQWIDGMIDPDGDDDDDYVDDVSDDDTGDDSGSDEDDNDYDEDEDFYDDDDEDISDDDSVVNVTVSPDFPLITEDDRIVDGDIKWSEKQQSAAYTYTDGNYEAINRYLRTGGTSKISDSDREASDTVRDMMRPAARNFTTFRRAGFDTFGDDITRENIAERLTGAELSDAAFMSTSISRGEIDHYSGRVVMQFEVPKGAKVLYIGSMTANETNDQELVLDAGTRYRVKSVSQSDEFTTTVVVEVLK